MKVEDIELLKYKLNGRGFFYLFVWLILCLLLPDLFWAVCVSAGKNKWLSFFKVSHCFSCSLLIILFIISVWHGIVVWKLLKYAKKVLHKYKSIHTCVFLDSRIDSRIQNSNVSALGFTWIIDCIHLSFTIETLVCFSRET